MKILFKLPSRGRRDRFFKALDSIVDNLHDKENYLISCTLDIDDEAMTDEETIQRICSYKNTEIEWGESASKIHAINRSMPETDWDILVVSSDDIFFNLYGFDEIIRNEMKANFPTGDAYLHFKESDTRDMLNVMTVIDKTYYSRFDYIYHPSFKSLWCDNMQMDVARILGRYKYIDYEIMVHQNPAYNKLPRDEMFDRQQMDWGDDERTYHAFKARNFDL